MKQQGSGLGRLVTIGLCVGLGCSAAAVADPGWVAPAPLGPYGGHFDFGIPAAEPAQPVGSAQEAVKPQAEYAVYQQQGELPVINAAYGQGVQSVQSEMSRDTVGGRQHFSTEELGMIDPAWSLEPDLASAPQGVNGDHHQGDVWALGELQTETLQALGAALPPVVSPQPAAQAPCSVPATDAKPRFTTAHTPFQEAVLDEFEQGELDMEAMGREADRLSRMEERRSRARSATVPIYYPTFMPDYALGVRRADAMDPLALIPQMSTPVQYFGFQQ
jgi:hypothetical protein